MEPDAALAACRFVHDASAMLLWGAFAYLAALVPRDLRLRLVDGLSAFRLCTIAAAVLSAAATLPIEVASIGNGGWKDVIDPETIRTVLFETSVGTAWQVQAVAALLLAATIWMPAPPRPALTAVASGVLLATLASTGHAAMHEGWLGVMHRLNDGAHVLCTGAWLGALVPLMLILREQGHDGVTALRRFSTVGHAAVALVIATGLANTALVLGTWPADWSSPYQTLLAIKIAIVLAMTILALANRYVVVPQMTRDRRAGQALRVSTAVEIGLALGAIGCVSVFGLMEPT